MEKTLDMDTAAACLAELGHPTRLRVFRLLVRAGPEGLPVGTLQSHLDIPGATLSHHLRHMLSAGLIVQEREGRVLRCCLVYRRVEALLEFLMSDCCAGLAAFPEANAA